jgi:hypothetical protein
MKPPQDHRVKRPFHYVSAADSREQGYLARRFAEIMKNAPPPSRGLKPGEVSDSSLKPAVAAPAWRDYWSARDRQENAAPQEMGSGLRLPSGPRPAAAAPDDEPIAECFRVTA